MRNIVAVISVFKDAANLTRLDRVIGEQTLEVSRSDLDYLRGLCHHGNEQGEEPLKQVC